MGRLKISALAPGMVLGEDVYAPTGGFVLRKKTVLQERHIRMLKIWGVPDAEVAGDEERETTKLPPDSLLVRSERLADGFFPSDWRATAVMAEVHRLVSLRLAWRMAEGRGLPNVIPVVRPEPPRPPWGNERPEVLSPERLLRGDVRLATYPDIYFRIKEVLDSPVSSATHIAEVVSKDPSLSARLLKLVNSSFYGFPSPIESIPRAIAIIGTRELTTLALAVSAMSFFERIPEEYVSMRSFWEHSVACGTFARMLAYVRRFPSEERFFLAGLFHDLGRLVLYRERPAVMAFILELSRFEGIPLYVAEDRILGFTHAQLGRRLLEKWNIPPTLIDPVHFHHAPLLAEHPHEAAIVHLADILAGALRIGTSGSFHVPSIDPEAWEALGLSPEAIEAVVVQGERQLQEVMHVFFSGGGAPYVG